LSATAQSQARTFFDGPRGCLNFLSHERGAPQIAVYKSGESIPTDDFNHPDIVALRLLGSSRHNDGPLTQTNVVGTQEQATQAKIDEMAGKLKAGKP
jgi:hypothetical protein